MIPFNMSHLSLSSPNSPPSPGVSSPAISPPKPASFFFILTTVLHVHYLLMEVQPRQITETTAKIAVITPYNADC